jgi:myosin heavy subunit
VHVQVSVPNGSDENYVEKMHQHFDGTVPCYSKPGRTRGASSARERAASDRVEDEPQFSIQHFADKVMYTATGWLEKNRGGMPAALTILVNGSEVPLVRAAAPPVAPLHRPSRPFPRPSRPFTARRAPSHA